MGGQSDKYLYTFYIRDMDLFISINRLLRLDWPHNVVTFDGNTILECTIFEYEPGAYLTNYPITTCDSDVRV